MKIQSQTAKNVKLLKVNHRMSFSTDILKREMREKGPSGKGEKNGMMSAGSRKSVRKVEWLEKEKWNRVHDLTTFFYCTRPHCSASCTNNCARTGGGALTALAQITELINNL